MTRVFTRATMSLAVQLVRPGWSLCHRRGGVLMLPGFRNSGQAPVHQRSVGVAEGEEVQLLFLRGNPAATRTATDRWPWHCENTLRPAAPAAVPPALWDGSHSCPEPVPGGWRETCRGSRSPSCQQSPRCGIRSGGGLLHGLLHGTDGAMGIREYQNFHRHFLSGEVFWFSIEDGGRFCKFFAWIPGALSRMRKN